MSDKKDTTHVLIDKQLVIFLRPRSAVWQCRYQVDKRWQRESTGEHELDKAKKRAHDLLIEANVRKKLNVAPITRYFKDIAKLAVQRMDDELQADNGKVIYKDYKSVIEKYLVPFFGKYKVDSIDYKVLEQFGDWRAKRMQAAPKHNTLLNHNAALNRIFDEAELRNYLLPISRPKLTAKGKKSERREEFNVEETRALIRNFDDWISKGRADSVAVRALLKDYVITLLDTGARRQQRYHLPVKRGSPWTSLSVEGLGVTLCCLHFSSSGDTSVRRPRTLPRSLSVFCLPTRTPTRDFLRT